MTDGSGTTQYRYDPFGNITLAARTELGKTYITAYRYDSADRILRIAYPDGRAVSYTRDPLGRITAVYATVNGTTVPITTNRRYRADGLLLSQTHGNGISDIRTYDTQGRMTYQSVGSIDTRVYTYDANGNLTQKQTLPEVGSYTYDALDRLTRDQIVTGTTNDQLYTYDANGNRTKKANTVYGYTPNTNRLIQAGAATLTLDAAGYTTTNWAFRYGYDQAGHLTYVYGGTTLKGAYAYNARHQRSRKVAGGTTTLYHYDSTGNLLLETGETGVPRTAYIYADTIPVAQIQRSGGTDILVYLHSDHLNTPRLATNTSGVKVWSWEGEAFGNTQPTGTVTVNLRFPGQYYDAESGLHYNNHRYVDPKTGRYLQFDPAGLMPGLIALQPTAYNRNGMPLKQPTVQSVNFYLTSHGANNPFSYVGSNPLRDIDPLGLDAELCSRLFYPTPLPTVRHCFIRFNGNNSDTMSYDNQGAHPDPAPTWWPKSCQATKGDQDDDCIKREMQKCEASDYDFTGNNCCHCAEKVMRACGQWIPAKDWPNWPANPGPITGNPGYKP